MKFTDKQLESAMQLYYKWAVKTDHTSCGVTYSNPKEAIAVARNLVKLMKDPNARPDIQTEDV